MNRASNNSVHESDTSDFVIKEIRSNLDSCTTSVCKEAIRECISEFIVRNIKDNLKYLC